MGGLLLGVIQEYMVSASFSLFMGPKELITSLRNVWWTND